MGQPPKNHGVEIRSSKQAQDMAITQRERQSQTQALFELRSSTNLC
jgi:hypothetical protein